MSECISSGAKQILGRLLKSIKADPKLGEKTYVTQLIKDLKALPVCKEDARKAKKPRKLSDWQLCIMEERSGQKFDPKAIKELSKKYRKGVCPSPEFIQKHRP